MTARNNARKISPTSAKPAKPESKEDIRKELLEKLDGMKADKENKCKAAKDQLVEMLEVTVDKYRTATGTAEALRVLRFVTSDDSPNASIWNANKLAHDMASITSMMAAKARSLDPAEMESLCDGFYDTNLKFSSEDWMRLAKEMMCIDLCRNVGDAAIDMASFVKRVNEEIDATQAELDNLDKED